MRNYFGATLRKTLLIVLAMALIMAALCGILLSGERKTRTQRLESGLYDGLMFLESQMTAVQSALLKVNENEHVMRLLQLTKMQRPNDYYRMKRAQETVHSIAFANAYVEDVMLMFRNADIVLTRYASFDAYGDFARHYALGCLPKMRTLLQGARYDVLPSFLPETTLSSSFDPEARSVLGYFFSASASVGNNEIVAFVFFDKERLMEEMLPITLPDRASFLLRTAAGSRLLSEGDSPAANGVLKIHAKSRLFEASLALPAAWLWGEMDGLIKLNIWFLLAALFFGVVISVFIARAQAKPVKQLLMAVSTPEETDTPRAVREMTFVRDEILRMNATHKDVVQQLDSMRETLRQTMMDRLLTQDLSAAQPLEDLSLLKNFPTRYAVCVGALRGDDEVVRQSAYLNAIRTRLPEGALFHQIAMDSFAVLFPCDERKEAEEALSGITQSLYFGQTPPMRVAVSPVVEGMEAAHAAFESASQALLLEASGALSQYAPSGQPLTVQNLLSLYRALISGSGAKANEILSTLYASAEISLESLFHTVHTVLLLAARDSLRNHTVPPLSYIQNPHRQLGALQKMAHTICAFADSEKRSHNHQLKQGILDYIHAHYADPNTYGQTIADHFRISDKYLYNFIKEQTGSSLGDYLTRLRLGRAQELLADRQLPVGQIYTQCGFLSSNTFYKAFKREFGLSPTEYRNRAHV